MQAQQAQALIMSAVSADLEALDNEIRQQLGTQIPLVEQVAQYIIASGGKRMRPIMALLAAQALGQQGLPFQRLAVVVEFIHTATLLHDDVVDQSAQRRGRQTANLRWGNAPAILVGDFLYSRAFQIMVGLCSMPVMDVFAQATNRIAEGEVWQLMYVGDLDLSQETYLEIVQAKTAELFSAAIQGAAALAGESAEQLGRWRDYGIAMGIAFQIMDDVLDYQGEAANLGKNVGDDLAEGKMTLPMILLRQLGSESEQQLLAQAITERDISKMPELIAAVQRSGALAQTKSLAMDYVARAKAAIADVPQSAAKQALLALADLAVLRES